MALYAIPVVVPYRLSNDEAEPVYTMAIDAVASGAQAAIATARIVLETQVRLIHGRRPLPLLDRCAVERASGPINGPYAYLFSAGDRVPHLELPARIEHAHGARLEQTLNGLAEPWVHGVVLDCAGLKFIASDGLSALAANAKRLELQLFRVPEPILKLLTIVGLHKHLAIHPDLAGALNGLLHKRSSNQHTMIRRRPSTTTAQPR